MWHLIQISVFFIILQYVPSLQFPVPSNGKKDIYVKEGKESILIIGRQHNVIHCHQYNNAKEVERILSALDSENTETVDQKKMDDLITFCNDKENTNVGEHKMLFIYPGTKWCGTGNEAKSENDLGSEEKTDMCCREHDHCKDYISGFGSKHSLKNASPFTMSHCKCDDVFYECLKNAGTSSAKSVGEIYFNLLRMQCFQQKNVTEKSISSDCEDSSCESWEIVNSPSFV